MEATCDECGEVFSDDEPHDIDDVVYIESTGYCKSCYDNFHYGEDDES